MRMNTRNLILIALAVVVMIGLIVIGRGGGDEADTEPTQTAAETGRLLPDLTAEEVVQFEVRGFEGEPEATTTPEDDAETPTPTPTPAIPSESPVEPGELVIERDEENIWTITVATNSTDRATDQMIVVGVVSLIVEIEYADRFSIETEGASLADFGLENPSYEILLQEAEDTRRILLGNTNPGGRRYYAQLEDDPDTVYLLPAEILNNVVNYTLEPPYVPAPTDTPTPLPTANPYSEVEQTATANAVFSEMATQQAQTAPTEAPAGPAAPDDDTEADTEDTSSNSETDLIGTLQDLNNDNS